MNRLTRRSVLVTLGAVATAGCPSGGDSYWGNPPAFDATGLEMVTERSLPRRPDPIPVGVGEAHEATVRSRHDDLLAAIPDPLTADVLPNGRFREEIESHRRTARVAHQRAETADSTIEAVEALAEAGEAVGYAAGVWAAISVDGDPDAVTWSRSTAKGEVADRGESLARVAPDARTGAAVYGPLEAWLYDAGHDTLVGLGGVESRPNPLRVGRTTARAERVRSLVGAVDHLASRYADTVETATSVEPALREALSALGQTVRERHAAFHDEDAENLHWYPDIEERLARDPQPGEPGFSLLRAKSDAYFGRNRPIAAPDHTVDFPALALRESHHALAVLDALQSLLDRVDDGDELFPADAETVREARTAAIESVASLSASSSPLERWQARRLRDVLGEGDEQLPTGDAIDERAVAEAYGEYVWVRLVADAVPSATETVRDALD